METINNELKDFITQLKNEWYKFENCNLSSDKLLDILEDEKEKFKELGLIEYVLDLQNEILQWVDNDDEQIILITHFWMPWMGPYPNYDKAKRIFKNCDIIDIIYIYYTFIEPYFEF